MRVQHFDTVLPNGPRHAPGNTEVAATLAVEANHRHSLSLQLLAQLPDFVEAKNHRLDKPGVPPHRLRHQHFSAGDLHHVNHKGHANRPPRSLCRLSGHSKRRCAVRLEGRIKMHFRHTSKSCSSQIGWYDARAKAATTPAHGDEKLTVSRL